MTTPIDQAGREVVGQHGAVACERGMNTWPYCEGHPQCHDSRTRQYARSFTGTLYDIGEGTGGAVIISAGSRDPLWGPRLCRSHALIRFGVA